MLRSHEDRRPRLLLVDDEPTNLHVLRQILGDDYRLQFATDGAKALQLAQQQPPDLILLDIMMPHINGYDVCRQLKQNLATQGVPVIFVTALSEMEDEEQGFEAGGVDYLLKPVRASIVKARVKNHLSLVRVDTLRESRLQIVQRLGRAAEYKDNETGMHVLRMSHFSHALALAIGCSPEWADDLLHAAPMHDVGKIGIPDAVLLKPGPLDDAEWAIMRQHPHIGAEIIGEHESGILQMARSIALTHHEKWDGSGYPLGLRAQAIPLAARIVAIADVFDALTSERPYKQAWSVDKALAHISAQAGAHFDPELVPAFLGLRAQIEAIRQRWHEGMVEPAVEACL
ncbi:MAG: two-component system response regulator [Comamonas sp.]|nr:two-component system response regulator [Comamonas sp.]